MPRHRLFGTYALANRSQRKDLRLSGILFGPPGTAKTTLAQGLAEVLGWPLISLGPYNFLQKGSEGVAVAAHDVFTWLYALEDCVILFDEMEEFMRSRIAASHDRDQHSETTVITPNQLDEAFADSGKDNPQGATTDYIQRLWTTLFLPLLQELRDEARVIFLVATNHFESVDPAIVRPGRFDFRIHVLPPTAPRKLREIFVPALRKQLQMSDDDWGELDQWLARLISEQRWVVKDGQDYSDTGTSPEGESAKQRGVVTTYVEMPYGLLLSEYFSIATV